MPDTLSYNSAFTGAEIDAAVGAITQKQHQPLIRTATLLSTGWSASAKTQRVTVSGVLADETTQLLNISPASSDRETCYLNGIDVASIANGSITFSAQVIPTQNIKMYISIQTARTT